MPQTIGFDMSDEDYLRSDELAAELSEIQSYGDQQLVAQGLTLVDVTTVTRQVLKGRD